MARDDTKSVVPSARSAFFPDQIMEPLSRLRGELDQIFETLPSRLPAFNFARSMFPASVPAVEMTETDKAYKISAELPGLKPGDVEITIDQGVLCISGEKREEREEKEQGYSFSERSYGSFERRIEMPKHVDAEKIRADFRDGVLKITLPKDEHAEQQKRRIEIGAS